MCEYESQKFVKFKKVFVKYALKKPKKHFLICDSTALLCYFLFSIWKSDEAEPKQQKTSFPASQALAGKWPFCDSTHTFIDKRCFSLLGTRVRKELYSKCTPEGLSRQGLQLAVDK